MSSVEQIVEQLNESGLLYDAAIADEHDTDVARLADTFEAYTDALRFDMFRHPVFDALDRNESLLTTLFIEYYHLIKSAREHISLALERAVPPLDDLLSDYLASEEDHYLPIETALRELIGSDVALERLAPMAGTTGVFLKTKELARTNTLAYIACCDFVEMRKKTIEPTQRHLQPKHRNVLAAFVNHAAEDIMMEHGGLFRRALAVNAARISAREAAMIFEETHAVKHAFDLMNHEILRVVAAQYGLRSNDLRSKTNAQTIVFPRQVAMYLCKELTDLSYPEIGKQFNNKHHSTVMHSPALPARLIFAFARPCAILSVRHEYAGTLPDAERVDFRSDGVGRPLRP